VLEPHDAIPKSGIRKFLFATYYNLGALLDTAAQFT
jgi:hypothetical protein